MKKEYEAVNSTTIKMEYGILEGMFNVMYSYHRKHSIYRQIVVQMHHKQYNMINIYYSIMIMSTINSRIYSEQKYSKTKSRI